MSSTQKIDHSVRKHALLSASGSSRWMNCTPSPVLESKFENTTSSYAEEGTLAHEFAELNLKLQLKLITKTEYNKLVKPFKEDKYYSKEMEDYVQQHVDYVISQYNEANRITNGLATLLIEQKVDLTSYIENGFGTVDNGVIGDGILEVIDFKYGKGVRVNAENNSQAMLYGLGMLEVAELMYDIHTVRLTIVQPRLDAISNWEISASDLKSWGENKVRPKAKMAYIGEGELNPGEWCKFCKVKAKCKALAAQSMEIAKSEFSDPELLEDDEIIDYYKQFPQILDWIKSVGDYLLAEAIKGKSWPEHKLVEGRSNRKWLDTSKVEEILKRKRFKKGEYLSEPALLGITKIEKLVGKDKFYPMLGNFIEKPQGKPTLVHESDKRPEFSVSTAEKDFEENENLS